MYDAFISYRRKNGFAVAKMLRDQLKLKKISAFVDLDELRNGTFDDKILTAIKNSPSFLLILFPGDLDRCAEDDDWLTKEITAAVDSGRNIIPILCDGFKWPKHWNDDIPEKIIDNLTRMGWLLDVDREKYSFSLRFGIYGERFYDSKSGKLVRVSKKPLEDFAEYHMSDEDYNTVLQMIWSMNISSYPAKYDPINPPDAEEKVRSIPYETIVFTYRAGDYETVITCEEVALAAGGYDDRAKAFLDLCDYIERIVVNSDEWKSLPVGDVTHE
jgi:hypothetical protein